MNEIKPRYCRKCLSQFIGKEYQDYCESCKLSNRKELPARISKCKKNECTEDCRNFYLAGVDNGSRSAKADAINKAVDRFKDFLIQAIVFGNTK